MAFPSRIWGSYGDEKASQSTRIGSLPLGTRMELPDGRVFAHAKAGGTSLVAGQLQMTMAEIDTSRRYEMAVAADAAIGATSVTLTTGGSALVADDYADGYLYINDEAAAEGEGRVFKIKSSASAAAASSAVFTLADGDTIDQALVAGSSVAGLRCNEFQNVVIYKAGTIVGQPAGVAPVDVTASYYCWLQRRGAVGALTAATAGAVGAGAVACLETNGAFKAYVIASGTTAGKERDVSILGYWMASAAGTAGDYSLIYLQLE